MPRNALYAQSGGMTAVINASAAGVLETARRQPERIGTVYAAKDGILGALHEVLYDTGEFTEAEVAALKYTPGGAFGACRFDLSEAERCRRQYERLLEVFRAYDIGYFFYNGGGGSMYTAHKVAEYARENGFPLTCIGIPKTVDNDLPLTDSSPGFGSAAKFVATAVRETGYDLASMATTSTKVFILEVMGRHRGWLAAAGALAKRAPLDAPHLILFAERPFDKADFLARVKQHVEQHDYCVIVVSEGLRTASGEFFSVERESEVYGWEQLGGVAAKLANLVERTHGYKTHSAVADYMQRSAAHIASATDVAQAYALGEAAVNLALAGENAIMPVIERVADEPYRWRIGQAALKDVADVEVAVPDEYITEDGYGVTEAGLRYLRPLIQGEHFPPFVDGLPDFLRFNLMPLPQQLPPYEDDC